MPSPSRSSNSSPSGSVTCVTLSLAMALSIAIAPVRAQAQSWASVNAVGYGSGATALWLTTADCEGFECLVAPIFIAPIVFSGGALVGAIVGHSADRSVESGEALHPVHLSAVSVGTVLAGATLGAVAAGVLLNASAHSPPRTFLGGRGQTLAILAAAGAGVGIGHLIGRWAELRGERGEVRFGLEPLVSERGAVGAALRFRFR